MNEPAHGHPVIPRVVVWFLLLAFAYQLGWCWLAPVPWIVGSVTNDDTFLYLQYARKTIEHGFPTFDGLNPTNGVQPLWGAALVALAAVTTERELLLRMALTACAGLNLAAGFVLLRMVRELGSRVAVTVVGVAWGCYLLGLVPALLGMENSLHGLAAALVLLGFVRLWWGSGVPCTVDLLLCGGALAFNTLTRLDSTVIGVVLGLLLWWRCMRRGAGVVRPLLGLAGPTVLAGGLYFVGNLYYFGAGLPVSGLMKAHYASTYLGPDPGWLWPVFVAGVMLKTFSEAPVWLLARFVPEALESVLLGVALSVFVLPMLIHLVMPRLVAWPPKGCRVTGLGLVLSVGTLAHMLVLATNLLHFSVDSWYHTYLLLVWMVWLAWGAERWLRSPVLTRRARQGFAVALGLFLASMQTVSIVRQLRASEVRDLHTTRYELASWLRVNLPPDVRLGAWNAGLLAYFSDQTVINLDGLMNSVEYARLVQQGDSPRDIVERLGLDVIVDYNDADSTMPRKFHWDPAATFRGLWSWDELVILHHETTDDEREFFVLGVPGGRFAAPHRR